MALSAKDIEAHVRETFSDEGKVAFVLAPIPKVAAGLPPTWREALAADDAVAAVLDDVWKPLAKTLPKTIAVMRKTLQHVGLLTTARGGHSIVYVFADEDGDPCLWRGHLPAKKLPKIAAELPTEFTTFYDVHDGWLDEFDQMGPAPSRSWRPLGKEGPSRDFLVTFFGHGPGDLGFDLQDRPPSAWTVWTAGKPSRAKNVAKEIDEWLEGQLEDFLPVKRRPGGKPAKSSSATTRAKKR